MWIPRLPFTAGYKDCSIPTRLEKGKKIKKIKNQLLEHTFGLVNLKRHFFVGVGLFYSLQRKFLQCHTELVARGLKRGLHMLLVRKSFKHLEAIRNEREFIALRYDNWRRFIQELWHCRGMEGEWFRRERKKRGITDGTHIPSLGSMRFVSKLDGNFEAWSAIRFPQSFRWMTGEYKILASMCPLVWWNDFMIEVKREIISRLSYSPALGSQVIYLEKGSQWR